MGATLTLPFSGNANSSNPGFAITNTGPGIQGFSLGGNGVTGLSGTIGPGGPPKGDGVFGLGKNGIHGQSSSDSDSGVWGENSGKGNGVSGTSVNGNGVFGSSQSGFAGLFEGKVQCVDTLTCLNGMRTNGDIVHIGKVQVQGGLETALLSCTGDMLSAGNVTCKDVFLPGGDCAEDFPAASEEDIEPGTVVVADDDEGKLRACRTAYDKRVVGVVSGAGAYRPAIVLDKQMKGEHRVTVALIGKVFCLVDARDSTIAVGDLLTTSATPGHAMKATDEARALGSIIGKALRPLPEGVGLVPILVSLR